jgi:hypothetical protein
MRKAKDDAINNIKKWTNQLNLTHDSNDSIYFSQSSLDSEKNYFSKSSVNLSSTTFQIDLNKTLNRSNSLPFNFSLRVDLLNMDSILSIIKSIDKFDGTPKNIIKFFDNIDNLDKVATSNNVAFINILPYIKNKIEEPLYSTISASEIKTAADLKKTILDNVNIVEYSPSIFSKIYNLRQNNFQTFDKLIEQMEKLYIEYTSALALESLKTGVAKPVNHESLINARRLIFSGQANLLFLNNEFSTFPEMLSFLKNQSINFDFLKYNNNFNQNPRNFNSNNNNFNRNSRNFGNNNSNNFNQNHRNFGYNNYNNSNNGNNFNRNPRNFQDNNGNNFNQNYGNFGYNNNNGINFNHNNRNSGNNNGNNSSRNNRNSQFNNNNNNSNRSSGQNYRNNNNYNNSKKN